MNIKLSILLLLISIPILSFAQIIENPVWTEKSHTNLSIDKIEFTSNETILYLTVVNQSNNNKPFCVSKNIYLKSDFSDGYKFELLKSENISFCPSKHNFTKVGESHKFKLIFNIVPQYITYIDLIEECPDACFYFRDIVLDKELTNEINIFNKAVADNLIGNKESALQGFIKVVEICTDKSSHRYGHSLTIIPVIYEELNKDIEAKLAYQAVLKSSLKDRSLTTKKAEPFTNYKHKTAILFSYFLENSGMGSEALNLILKAENEYPFQYDNTSIEAYKKDHYEIVRRKIYLLDMMGYKSSVIEILIHESLKKGYGKFPKDLNKMIVNLLIETYGKETCLKEFDYALSTFEINNKLYPSQISFWLFNINCTLYYDGKLTKRKAKKEIEKLPFYNSIIKYVS